MHRSNSSSGISPQKLREACIEYLQRQASPESSEYDERLYEKNTREYLSRQIRGNSSSGPKAVKSFLNDNRETYKKKTNRIHEQIAALVGKDRIIVTERTERDIRQSTGPSIEDLDEASYYQQNYYKGAAPVKWKDVQELQKSVGDIKKKLHKVEHFFSNLSTEKLQKASKARKESWGQGDAVKGNHMFMDKIDMDKIRLFEKFSRNLMENEMAKKKLMDDMRQEIETLARKEEEVLKKTLNKSRRAQSVARGESLEKINLKEFGKIKTSFRESEQGGRFREGYRVERPVHQINSSRDYHQEFLKRRDMMHKFSNAKGTMTNSSRDEKVDGYNYARPPERQQVPRESYAVPHVDRNLDLTTLDLQSRFVKKNEDAMTNEVRAIQPVEDDEPVLRAPKKTMERQFSQPLPIYTTPDEELKTITLKVPEERKPYNPSKRKSTGNIEKARSQEPKAIPTTSQNVEASKKPKNYLPELRKFLEKKGNKKADWERMVEKDMDKKEKFEMLKVNIGKMEEKTKRTQQKIKYAGNRQDVVEEKDNLDKYYVDSIKAKLAAINQLNS